jgi:hypothetical protein
MGGLVRCSKGRCHIGIIKVPDAMFDLDLNVIGFPLSGCETSVEI